MCVDKGTGAMSSSPMAHTSAWAWARNPPHWHHLMPHKRLRPVTRHRHLTQRPSPVIWAWEQPTRPKAQSTKSSIIWTSRPQDHPARASSTASSPATGTCLRSRRFLESAALQRPSHTNTPVSPRRRGIKASHGFFLPLAYRCVHSTISHRRK